MTSFNIADLFERVADAIPDRLAVVAGERRTTYAELDERATRFANVLTAEGTTPGDPVAILSENRMEWIEAMLGCFKARAVPINVNHRYARDEILHVLNDSRSVGLLMTQDHVERLGDTKAAVPALQFRLVVGAPTTGTTDYESAVKHAEADRPRIDRSGDDRYVLYTGGTTGVPKGVVWRMEDLFFAALRGGNLSGDPITAPDQIVDVLTADREPWLVTSPLMHGNGQWNSLLPLLTGRGVILWTGRRFDGGAIAALAEAERPHLLVLVGDAMALPFLDAVEGTTFDLGSIRVVASGGAMLSPTTKQRLEQVLETARIVDGFGASETGSSGTMVGSGSTTSLPRFRVGGDVAVLDDSLRPVAAGHVGRLARCGHIPVGYWNDPEKTEVTFPTDADGVRWAIPGDLARSEGDGTFTLLGRGSSCINTGGEKVHPDEVAHALKTHPGVDDALVVGVPDERFGETVAALIATGSDPGPDDDALRKYLRPILAGYKLPRRIVRVSRIRYTVQGKPDLEWATATATALTPGTGVGERSISVPAEVAP
jgi:fatty-acyl-CoA synthase